MYQLVIIGASPEGLKTARSCVEQYPSARIALVTHGWEEAFSGDRHNGLAAESFWENLRLLAAQGADVVIEKGIFSQPSSGLVYQTEKRTLLGENYLLTSVKNVLAVPGQIPDNAMPQRWAIVGALPENLVLAQELTKRGHGVTILSRNNHLLPGEDREMTSLLQCYLASLGIAFYCNYSNLVSHHDQCNQTYTLQFNQGNDTPQQCLQQCLEVDNLIHQWRSPECQNLLARLPEFNQALKESSYLSVNHHLQTAQGQIYACGNWLKGYHADAIAYREAQYVVQRVLGKQTNPIDYSQMSFTIDLDPPWCRIGTFANSDSHRQIIRGFEPYTDHCNLRGMYKLVIDRQDRIVSAHWFGQRAREGMTLLQLAIAKGITWTELRSLPPWEDGQVSY
ncbi:MULTISPECIES: FAD-dependent oxidoreductase [unclassified Synechocystis]|uniref:FAD-dependent oxidoreductase n=1 Tax=unclassified Synechocystis TaxID=2640012 RepID=UPI00040A408D|nr:MULTISPECIES: FAD-dependent oxidoreductase [unclassified Synechocystis]AIE74143.1 hypothetical protein D082_16150 [Synechocystis sp. PCC 6714]MCT0252782.1 FAD-dependent oxidoreductase [Synechocystis sp. CS-94]